MTWLAGLQPQEPCRDSVTTVPFAYTAAGVRMALRGADARLIVRNAVPPQRLLSLLQTDKFDCHVVLNKSHALVALTDLGPDDLDVL